MHSAQGLHRLQLVKDASVQLNETRLAWTAISICLWQEAGAGWGVGEHLGVTSAPQASPCPEPHTSIAWLCILNPLEIACGLRRLLLQVPSQHLVVPRPRVRHGCEASPGVDLHLATAKDATRAVGGAFIGQSRLLPSGFALLHSCGSFSGKLPCGQPFQLGFSKMSNLIYCHLM